MQVLNYIFGLKRKPNTRNQKLATPAMTFHAPLTCPPIDGMGSSLNIVIRGELLEMRQNSVPVCAGYKQGFGFTNFDTNIPNFALPTMTPLLRAAQPQCLPAPICAGCGRPQCPELPRSPNVCKPQCVLGAVAPNLRSCYAAPMFAGPNVCWVWSPPKCAFPASKGERGGGTLGAVHLHWGRLWGPYIGVDFGAREHIGVEA